MSLSELLALHGELGPGFYILLGNTLELEIKAFEDISIFRIYRVSFHRLTPPGFFARVRHFFHTSSLERILSFFFSELTESVFIMTDDH